CGWPRTATSAATHSASPSAPSSSSASSWGRVDGSLQRLLRFRSRRLLARPPELGRPSARDAAACSTACRLGRRHPWRLGGHRMTSAGFDILTAIIVVPAVGALVVGLLSRRRPELCRQVAVLFSLL